MDIDLPLHPAELIEENKLKAKTCYFFLILKLYFEKEAQRRPEPDRYLPTRLRQTSANKACGQVGSGNDG